MIIPKIQAKVVCRTAFSLAGGILREEKNPCGIFKSCKDFRHGGRNRTRTCDPIDVNDVLCRSFFL